ncbi:MAG: RNA methyltransferase [Planctomycetota bacterium]|nr:RNA methyltransferase [Planctomycetota bacterium]
MNSSTVTLDDPRLEDFRFVRERDLMGRDGRPGLFIGESVLVVGRMASVPGVLHKLLCTEQREHEARLIVDSARSIAPSGLEPELIVAPASVVEAITGFHFHRAVLATGRRTVVESRSVESVARGATLLLACEDISNMDNAGALFRDAAAFGVDGVLLSPDSHDPLYRKCLRTSMGHALSIPFARSEDLPQSLTMLASQGFRIIATVIDPSATPVEQVARASKPSPVVLVVGHEHRGLSPAILASCTEHSRIPMADGVDSLNVAVAAAVHLHHLRCPPH